MNESRRPYGGRSPEQRRADRRARLRSAGLECFGTAGYGATSIERLCQLARVSTRNFYQEYGSKEALLVALYNGVHERALAMVTSVLSRTAGAPIERRLELAVRAYVTTTASDPRWAQLSYVEVIGVSAELERLRVAWRQRWARVAVAAARRMADHEKRSGSAASGRSRTREFGFELDAVALIGAINELIHYWSTQSGAPQAPTAAIGPAADGLARLDDIVGEVVRLATAVLAADHRAATP